jgi:hypothetical protein
MKNIKNFTRIIFKFYLNVCTFIGFVFMTLCLVGSIYLFITDSDFLAIDSCIDAGKVWDYEQRVCRDDCLTWNETEGCVPLK